MKEYEERDKQREKNFIKYFKHLDWQSQDEVLYVLENIRIERHDKKKGD